MTVPSTHHHVIEPRNMPTTIVIDSNVDEDPALMDAKIPTKLKIVIGFVNVRKNTSLTSFIP